MDANSRWILASSFAVAAAGFLWPFWPLSLLGVLLSSASGRYIAAIGIGLLLDVAYGTPLGHWQFLYIPFTLFAVVTSLLRYYLSSYIRQGQHDTL